MKAFRAASPMFPRGTAQERAKLRERVEKMDYLDPVAWSRANRPTLVGYLKRAAKRIEELQKGGTQ